MAPADVDVVVSRWVFALWWLALLTVHALAAGYNTAYALFYLKLDGTYLNTVLEFLSLGMPSPYHRRIAVTYAVMGALHGVCLLLMVVGPLWHRSLRFTLRPVWLSSCFSSASRNGCAPDCKFFRRAVARIFHELTDHDGLFGVDSAHFHMLLIVREAAETLLQTIQAYRMSAVLPRASVNRFFIALLAMNCFAPMIVRRIFKLNESRKRFANLMCECLLDLTVTLGIPILIVVSYVDQYDPYIKGFPPDLWYNDEWSARVQNEVQLVLVVSWSDLISRIIFSWGLLSTSTGIKSLLMSSSSGSLVAVVPSTADFQSATPVGPPSEKIVGATGRLTVKVPTVVSLVKVRRLLQLKRVYYGFVLWGIVILGLHIHAEMQPTLPQCLLQVRPWAHKRSSCYLVDLDCHRLGIQGLKQEVGHEWSALDGSTVVQILVRHCPSLEIPAKIQSFKNLNGIKVYNSSIVEWGSDAAVTGKHHPMLIMVYLVRVNLTDGVIPQGLLSRDFPPMLIDFEIVVSNLRSLPDDLDQIWPLGSSVYIEFGNLTAVPAPMIRLQSYYMSVCGNPITELPSELFEVDNLIYLHAGSTLISELPRGVTKLSDGLTHLFLTDTDVSALWPWVDPLVERLSRSDGYIFAGGSSYCDALEHFWASGNDGPLSLAPEAVNLSSLSILMDPNEHQAMIQAVIICEKDYAGPLYSLAEDDGNMALSPVEMPSHAII